MFPVSVPVISQVFGVFSPMRVFVPAPPLILVTLPPLRVKVSSKLPPTRLLKSVKLIVPLMIPSLMSVISQVLAVLAPIKVLSAALVPITCSIPIAPKILRLTLRGVV